MPVRQYRSHTVEVNDEGFMVNADQWTPDVAEGIAEELGLRLTDRHWTVITFCREDAAREGQPPGLRRITKLGGVGMKEMYELFPKAPGKLAARVAGLPKPKGCV